MKRQKLSPEVEEADSSCSGIPKHHKRRKALVEKLWNHPATIPTIWASSVNYEPFPDGTFERLQRNDIWQNILEYLSGTIHVKSAYYTCSTFGTILREPQNLLIIALSLVLRYIREKPVPLYKENNAVRSRGVVADWLRNNEWDKMWPKVRSVCKSWKEIVDFEYTDFTNETWFLTTKWIEVFPRIKFLRFKSDKDLERAWLPLRSPHLSTFLIRNVTVAIIKKRFVQSPQEFFTRLLNILRVHGIHVRSFSLDWNFRTKVRDIFSSLYKMLECMPNLKAFCLDYVFFPQYEDQQAIQNFIRRLNQNSMPALNSIEFFKCRSAINASLLSQILRKCVNLRSIDHLYSENQIVTDELREALLQLKLERYRCSMPLLTAITSGQTILPLRNLMIDSWNDAVLASTVIPVINRFYETLEHLVINGLQKDDTNVCFDLPRLRVIQLIRTRGRIGFDDLLLLKSLENATLDLWGDDDHDNAIVKVRKYLESNEMNKSNVWLHFPKLMYITVVYIGRFNRPSSF